MIEKTRTSVTYEAEDGEEFEDAHECRLYEMANGYAPLPDGFIALDEDGKRQKYYDYDSVYVIDVKDDEAFEVLRKMQEECVIGNEVDEKGCWVYLGGMCIINDGDSWVRYGDIVKTLEEIKSFVRNEDTAEFVDE